MFFTQEAQKEIKEMDTSGVQRQPVALITGCSKGGIGYGLTERLCHRGWKVFATGRTLSKMDDLKKLGCEVSKSSLISPRS